MSAETLQLKIQSYMGKATRGEATMSEETLDKAAASFREALDKQFNGKQRKFSLRMSNIGRPLCQLQHDVNQSDSVDLPYYHVMRMMIGDAVEVIGMAVMEEANVPIESEQDEVELDVEGNKIKGHSDLDIYGKVWDVKSASPYSFKYKFGKGYSGIKENDDFGYVAQGHGYGEAKGKPFGGWIVFDKSSGEPAVVPATDNKNDHEEALEKIKKNVLAIVNDEPFQRQFEDEPEFFNKKPTGNRVLCKTCELCAYKYRCWPDTKYVKSTHSTAKNPPKKHYTFIAEENRTDDDN